jgi:ribosomal protein S8
MLNNLKNAVRTKKLIFYTKFCRKNNNTLSLLLLNNLIAGFSKNTKKANITIFVNYSSNFLGSVFSFSNYALKISKQQTKIVQSRLSNCNNIGNLYKIKKRPKYSVKFR